MPDPFTSPVIQFPSLAPECFKFELGLNNDCFVVLLSDPTVDPVTPSPSSPFRPFHWFERAGFSWRRPSTSLTRRSCQWFPDLLQKRSRKFYLGSVFPPEPPAHFTKRYSQTTPCYGTSHLRFHLVAFVGSLAIISALRFLHHTVIHQFSTETKARNSGTSLHKGRLTLHNPKAATRQPHLLSSRSHSSHRPRLEGRPFFLRVAFLVGTLASSDGFPPFSGPVHVHVSRPN